MLLAGSFEELEQHVASPRLAAFVEECVEGLDPLLGLVWVDVRQLRGKAFVDHGGRCRAFR
jgi:hypothetical protein